jgi:hypothetical protein
MRIRKDILALIGLNLCIFIIALLLGELYLSATDRPSNHQWGWRYMGKRVHELNQLGYRGQQIYQDKNNYVVLLVGDSQVVSESCVFETMPEKRLEYYLSSITGKSIKVFTLGAAGYGQDQQLLALREYFRDYSADFVIVWETPGNDIWNNMFPTHWAKDGTPKPTFWLDENASLKGPRRSLYRFRLVSLIDNIFFKTSLDGLWEKNYMPPPYQPMTEYSGVATENWYVLNRRAENIENEKTHVILSLVPRSERTEYGVRLTNKLLKAMQEESEINGAGFVAFAVDRPDFPLADGVYKLKRGSKRIFARLSVKQYWENIAEVNQNIAFFMIPLRVKNFMNGRDPHLNEIAVDQVMKDLAIVLKPKIK